MLWSWVYRQFSETLYLNFIQISLREFISLLSFQLSHSILFYWTYFVIFIFIFFIKFNEESRAPETMKLIKFTFRMLLQELSTTWQPARLQISCSTNEIWYICRRFSMQN